MPVCESVHEHTGYVDVLRGAAGQEKTIHVDAGGQIWMLSLRPIVQVRERLAQRGRQAVQLLTSSPQRCAAGGIEGRSTGRWCSREQRGVVWPLLCRHTTVCNMGFRHSLCCTGKGGGERGLVLAITLRFARQVEN